MLPQVTENIFVYRKDAKPFIKGLLQKKQKELGYSFKYIKEKLGMHLNSGGNWTKYCRDTEFLLLPTKEHWSNIQELFGITISYSDIEETYKGIHGLTNVWNDINFYIKNRSHPSEKPVELAERCVTIFSQLGDAVFTLFVEEEMIL